MLKSIVVEDEPAARRELVVLTPWDDLGIVCSGEASDGIEALELTKRLQPDIILTDIRMPRMDGISYIRTVAESVEPAAFPEFIILSGYSEFEYARTAMMLGVDEYLLKPVEDIALRAAILRATARIEERTERAQTERNFFHEYDPASSASGSSNLIDSAVRLIKSHYIQGISIEEAAAGLKISAGHLSRIFKQETGYTFVDYLMYIRIRRAIELLRDPTIKVYEVADLVGYSDARYFGQVFKKITGLTPREFKAGEKTAASPSAQGQRCASSPNPLSDNR